MDRINTPLHLSVIPSNRLVCALHALHLVVILCLLFSPIPWVPIVILLAMVSLSWRVVVVRYRVASVCSAIWQADDRWSLTGVDGSKMSPRRFRPVYLSSWLTVVAFKTDRWKPLYLVLLTDNTDPEQYRQLRVRLLNWRDC